MIREEPAMPQPAMPTTAMPTMHRIRPVGSVTGINGMVR
jgi:hypothetical protein